MVGHFLVVFILPAIAAQTCQNINVSTSEFVSVTVQITTKDGSNVYEIAAGKNPQMEVFFLPVNSSSCPRGCTYDLLPYISPKNDSVLHLQGQPHPLFAPVGYNMLETGKLSCAMQLGFCGANIPLYRHYKVQLGGILHAYSFDLNPIVGYTREWLPLCYGWTTSGSIPMAVTAAAPPTSTHFP